MSDPPIDIDSLLQLGTGITSGERKKVISVLETVEGRLRSLDESTLNIEAWVKNRGDDDQIVYLSVKATDIEIVAHDQSSSFDASLLEARNDLRRQLSDRHSRQSRRR